MPETTAGTRSWETMIDLSWRVVMKALGKENLMLYNDGFLDRIA